MSGQVELTQGRVGVVRKERSVVRQRQAVLRSLRKRVFRFHLERTRIELATYVHRDGAQHQAANDPRPKGQTRLQSKGPRNAEAEPEESAGCFYADQNDNGRLRVLDACAGEETVGRAA
jgi:hypothetical protein